MMVCLDSQIGDEDARLVAGAFKVNQTVAQIDLYSMRRSSSCGDTWISTDVARACAVNQLGDEGARAVAETLRENQTVTDIDLSCE